MTTGKTRKPFNTSSLSGPATSQIRKKAAQTRTPARKYASAFLNEIGVPKEEHDDYIIMGGIKEDDAINRKAVSQYGGNRDAVDDGCRLMIPLDTPKQLAKALQIFGANMRNHPFNNTMMKHGKGYVHRKEPRDYVTQPKRWGWMGLQLKMETTLSNGQNAKFEVQIIMKGMKKPYDVSHTKYEKVRTSLERWEQSRDNIHNILTADEIKIVQSILDGHRTAAETCGADVFYENFPILEDPPPMIREPDIKPIHPEEPKKNKPAPKRKLPSTETPPPTAENGAEPKDLG